MINFGNIELFVLGIMALAIAILGFSVLFNDKKSASNRAFFLFSMVTVSWGIANYLQVRITVPDISFMLIRFVIFLGTWHAFALFNLFFVFPKKELVFPKWYPWLTGGVAMISLMTLTPAVFSSIKATAPEGYVTAINVSPGVTVFLLVVAMLIISGITFLIQKTRKASGAEKEQFRLVLIGTVITFALLIAFNIVLPIVLERVKQLPYTIISLVPFVGFVFYAIQRGLLNIKVIAAEMLLFAMVAIPTIEVLLARNATEATLRILLILVLLVVGIVFIRSVRREVEQKEKLQKLSEELEAVNEELKRTEKLKAEFFSFAAHQVKSPMAVIKGYATLIGDGTLAGVPQEKIVEIAKKISTAASRTLAMVNNLLDMRKIEEGRMVYSFEQINVVPPIRTIVADLETLAKDKSLALTFEASQEEVVLNMDIQKFTQVIQNLIDNAVKYTEAGWVKVSVSLNDGKVLFTVSDSGRGISKDFAAKMFSQFARDPALAQDTKGTGLGLFIAKQIIEAHGGKIWASSEGEGAGSTFSVEIPLDNKAVTEKMGS